MTTVKVSTLRELRGHLTRQQVAEATEMSSQTLVNAEKRPESMTIATAKKLADFYCVSVDSIIERVPPTK